MTVESLIAGAFLGLGLVLIYQAWKGAHLSLAERVRQGRSVESDIFMPSIWASLRRAWLRVAESLGSTAHSVQRRLELLGGQQTLVHFRVQQLVAAIVAMVILGTASVLFLRSLSVASVVFSMLSLGMGALVGVAVWDQLLTLRARQRQAVIDQQVPDTCDLLALAIGAGESIPAALERMSCGSR